MENARPVIQRRSYALGILVALSFVLLQGQSCDRGNTDLTNLEFEVDGGPDLIVGFDTLDRSYDVSTSGSTVTVRAQAVFGVNTVSWQWLVGTTTIGSGPIGTGSGEVTLPIPIPDGQSVLRIVVQSNQVGTTASGYYAINVTKLTDAVTETSTVECGSDFFSLCVAINPCFADFQLTVDPLSAVVANQSFDAESTGYASLPDEVLNGWGAVAGGFVPHRAALVGGTVPAVVVSGATGPDVNLQLAPTEWTCAVDASGNFGPGVGPYPACDPANDLPFQDPATGLFANTDCVGVNGIDPDTSNPCAAFVELTVVDGTGDACQACGVEVGNAGFQLCGLTGYCATLPPLAFPLSREIGSYTAETDPEARFGFTPSTGSPPPLQFVAQYPGVSVLGATGLFADSVVCGDRNPSGAVSLPVAPELPPVTEPLTVGCTGNVASDVSILSFELTVDPGVVIAGAGFLADITGIASLTESFLDVAQAAVPGGVREVQLISLAATAEVGGTATGADVELNEDPSALASQCDLTGTLCDPANDVPGNGNTDCIPQGSFNNCLQGFAQLPVIDGTPNSAGGCTPPVPDCDCSACLALDAGSGCTSGLDCVKEGQCLTNGFCVAGDLPLPLNTVTGSYTAGASGTDFTYDWVQPYGIDVDGTILLPAAVFADPPAPVGVRMSPGGLFAARQCAGAVDSGGPDGVGVPDKASPTPVANKITFTVP